MRLTSIVGLLTLLEGTKSKLEVLPDELSTRASLSQCVSNAASYFLKYGQIISLSVAISKPTPSEPSAVALDHILISRMFVSNKWSLMIRKAILRVPYDEHLRPIGSYVIQIREFNEIPKTFELLKDDVGWNPHGKFFIISSTFFQDVNVLLSKIVAYLWTYKIVNVVLLFPERRNGSSYQVYTWYPFLQGKCGNDFKVQLIDRCKHGAFEYKGWFQNKIPKDLGNCSIKVRTSIVPPFVMQSANRGDLDGFEVKLLNTIAAITNLSLTYSLSLEPNRYGDVHENGTITGSYLDLKDELVDVLMGYVVPRISTQLIFDVIPAYFQDALIVCVPHSKPKNDWMVLMTVVNPSVLGLCLVLLFASTALIYGFSKFATGEFKAYESIADTSFNLFGSLIGASLTILPRSEKIRLLLMMWIIFCLHFRNIYVSNLMTTLTNQGYEDDMKDMDDIFKRHLNVLLYPLCAKYINVSNIERYVNVSTCLNLTACLYRTAYVEDSAICCPKLYVHHLLHGFIDESNRPRLFCFKDDLASFPIQMLMWKGFPFKRRIETLVNQLNAAGFIFYWERIVYESTRRNVPAVMDDRHKVLNITHLSAVFLLFGFGICAAILVFVLENLCRSKSKRKIINI